MSKLKFVAAVLVGFLAPIQIAQASSLKNISYEDYVPLQRTKLVDKFVHIPQFNPELGNLKSVLFRLTGEVEGSVKIENGDAADALITADLGADVSLLSPNGETLLTVLPTASISQSFAAGDGKLDFIDFSGGSVKNLTGLKNYQTKELFLQDNFDFFIGTEKIEMPVLGNGKSIATGAGNLLAAFTTNAGAKVEVVYDYEPIIRKKPTPPKRKIPESPLSVAVLAAAGVGLLLKNKPAIGNSSHSES